MSDSMSRVYSPRLVLSLGSRQGIYIYIYTVCHSDVQLFAFKMIAILSLD